MPRPIHRPRQPLALAILACLGISAAARNAAAEVQFVTSCNDSGAGSLRAAIAAAGDGDTIDMFTMLQCSRITLDDSIVTDRKNLSLLGPGINRLTITGGTGSGVIAADNSSADTFYLGYFTVADGNGIGPGCVYAKGNLSLRGMVVTGCTSRGNVGGGVRTRANLTLVNSVIENNLVTGGSVGGGGGAWVDGDATLSNSTVTGNSVALSSNYSASLKGGGLYVGGNLTMTDSSVENNSVSATTTPIAVLGGGIFVEGDASIVHSVVSGNSLSAVGIVANGGGVYVGNTVGPTDYAYFHYSSISDNSVTSSSTAFDVTANGGGIYVAKPAGARYSTVDGNRARNGAGVFASRHLNIFQSTVTANRANYNGGAIYSTYPANTEFLNSTIAQNFSNGVGGCGGVFFANGGTLTSVSNIIAKNSKYNSASSPCDLGVGSNKTLTIGAASSNNLIQSAPSSVHLPADTLTDDPQFFAFADNGGPTKTLGIKTSSPAHQTGLNIFDFQWDQRGGGFPRTIFSKTDIGAFESEGPGDGDTIFRNGFDPLIE